MFSFFKKNGNAPDDVAETAQTADAPDANPPATETTPDPAPSWFDRLKTGLKRSRTQLGSGLSQWVLGRKVIDAECFESLETALLTADIGVEATEQILANLTQQVSRQALTDPNALLAALRAELVDILTPAARALEISKQQPHVILMVGINGVGKTTTIGKLAKQLQAEGKSVLLAAGDTFRAAAVEQLQVWGERNQIPVVAQPQGSDAASVIFDALQAAKARQVDVLIADTAGRLHTQNNLMEELKKIKRVMAKVDPTAPHEILLVLDAGTGQNALSQAQQFHEAVGVTGIALTKLDGTAKGGIIFAIARKTGLPIRLIGVGEGIDDLKPFTAEAFVDALLSTESD